MLPEEKLYQDTYNGIASNIDNNSVRRPKEEICDEGVDLCETERANKNMHKDEEAGVNITERVNAIANDHIKAILSVQDDIKDLQEALENTCAVMMELVNKRDKDYDELKNHEKKLRLIETIITRQDKTISKHEQKINKMQLKADDSEDLNPVDGAPASDNQQEFSTGGLLGSLGSSSKDSNISVRPYTKGIDFFAGLKDKVSSKDEEESKESNKFDEDDSAMGRPFCKVVKGKPVERKDLYEGMSEKIQIMSAVYDVYDIDYTHFFKNMHKLGSFSRFEVRLTGEKMPKHEEDILLRLGNVYFASAKVNDYWLRFTSRTSVNVEKIRLIPSFFKLGKIFGAKTYPEFMDAIEVKR